MAGTAVETTCVPLHYGWDSHLEYMCPFASWLGWLFGLHGSFCIMARDGSWDYMPPFALWPGRLFKLHPSLCIMAGTAIRTTCIPLYHGRDGCSDYMRSFVSWPGRLLALYASLYIIACAIVQLHMSLCIMACSAIFQTKGHSCKMVFRATTLSHSAGVGSKQPTWS